MMLSEVARFLAASAVACAIVLAPTAAAGAAAIPSADPQTIVDARAFMSRYGVDLDTQDRLITAYESGVEWQAAASANAPVDRRTFAQGSSVYSVNTYSDGSINVSRLEGASTKAPGSSIAAISECSRSGSSYTNCKVDFWYGLVSMSFRADYSLAPGANDVTSVYAAAYSIGGACGSSINYFGRPSTGLGRLEVQAQMCGVGYSTTFWLQLAVSGNTASFTFG